MNRVIKALLSILLLIWSLGIFCFLIPIIISSLRYNIVVFFIAAALAVLALAVLVVFYMYSLYEESRFEKVMVTADEHFSKGEYEKAIAACKKAQEFDNEEEDNLKVLEKLKTIYEKTDDSENIKSVGKQIKALKSHLGLEVEVN